MSTKEQWNGMYSKMQGAVEILVEMKEKLVDPTPEAIDEEIIALWEECLIRRCFWNLLLPLDCIGIRIKDVVFKNPNESEGKIYTLQELDEVYIEWAKNLKINYVPLFQVRTNEHLRLRWAVADIAQNQ